MYLPSSPSVRAAKTSTSNISLFEGAELAIDTGVVDGAGADTYCGGNSLLVFP